MARILAVLTGEGFECVVREDDQGRVYFKADADIDADGANGQNCGPAAYMVADRGSEALANGGMRWNGSKVVGNSTWFGDIVILGSDGQPKEFPGGIIASKTAYRYPGMSASDPKAYVDSETIPYIVVPPIIIQRVVGIVKGCLCRVSYKGKTADGVMADVGPRTKIGELSIEMARRVGIPSSPRTGGIEGASVDYELWPGVPAVVDGKTFALIPSV